MNHFVSPTRQRGHALCLRWRVGLTAVVVAFSLGMLAPSACAQVAPPIPPVPHLKKLSTPDRPPADPPGDGDENPLKIAERGVSNAKDATERLASQNAGEDTQAAQKRTLKAIDDLLKNQNPPPPMGGGGGGGSPPPPMGGGGSPPPPMGGNSKPMGGSKKPMGGQQPMGGQRPMPMGSQQPMPMGGQPMPMGGQPMPMGGQPMPMGGNQQPMGGENPGQGGAKSPPGVPLPERITKDVWGHLPPQLRQQMSQFYREQFMPKYSELLRQYYSSLAEKEKEKKR